MESLGGRIRWARERAGLTQSELARRVDVAAGSRVSEWENDRRQPSAPVLMALPAVLGVSGHWLLTGDGARILGEGSLGADVLLRALQRILSGEIPSDVVRMLSDPSASAYLTGARRPEAPHMPEPAVPTAILRRRWLAARIQHHESPYYLDLEPGATPADQPTIEEDSAAAPAQATSAVSHNEDSADERAEGPSIYEGGYVWGHLAH